MAPAEEGEGDAALSLARSILKLDSRDRGGKGDETFRLLASAEVCWDVSTASSVVLLRSVALAGLSSCLPGCEVTGAETWRFPFGFEESVPRLGRRMLPDLMIQLPGEEKVIEIERLARLEGVSSGLEFEESGSPALVSSTIG